jgi:hypothetical protein
MSAHPSQKNEDFFGKGFCFPKMAYFRTRKRQMVFCKVNMGD